MAIDATYTHDAKGRDNDKSQSAISVAKSTGNTWPIRDMKFRRHEGRSSAFYRKGSKTKRRPLLHVAPTRKTVFASIAKNLQDCSRDPVKQKPKQETKQFYPQ